jgi:hypothetical protein
VSELKQQEDCQLDSANELLWSDPSIQKYPTKTRKCCVNSSRSLDEDYFCLLVAERLRIETLEEDDDLQLAVEYRNELAKETVPNEGMEDGSL